MSAAEVAYRVDRSLYSRLERAGVVGAHTVPEPDLTATAPSFVGDCEDLDPSPYCRAADRTIAGRFDIFSLKDTQLGHPPRWNRDPLTGTEVSLSFGKSLNYRDVDLVGDIKYLWEPNRHLHLVALAQAYVLSQDRKYLEAVSVHLRSWLDQCPYLLGPNWASSLELGLRLINWSLVWQLLGRAESPLFEGQRGARLRDEWLASVYRHADFIRGHLSRFSSANNHLIGELTGLFVAATTWPFWDVSADWREYAGRELAREALLQNAPDGVNREQSINYHQHALDFLLLGGLAGRSCGYEFAPDYWQRIESMLEYLAATMDKAGNVPMIGDSDNGHVVRLSQEDDFSRYRSLLATGAIIFSRGDMKAKAGLLDHKTLWLLGSTAGEEYEALTTEVAALPSRRAFPEGGYYLLGSGFETEDEIRVIADAGPLGYLSIAAHGHADALAFTLSVGGHAFLVDPGTYTYHTNRRWRDYFRGTSAHNTVRVDSQDQSVPISNFMWGSKADAKCEVFESGPTVDRFVGTHTGYLRLKDPVRHRRELKLVKADRRLDIVDTLECEGAHVLELFYHFAEDCLVVGDGGCEIIAKKGNQVLHISADVPTGPEIYYGDEARPAGWVSRELGVKVPAATVVWRIRIVGTTLIRTTIKMQG